MLPKVQLATRTKKKNGDKKEAVVKVHKTKNNDNNYITMSDHTFMFLKHLTSTHRYAQYLALDHAWKTEDGCTIQCSYNICAAIFITVAWGGGVTGRICG